MYLDWVWSANVFLDTSRGDMFLGDPTKITHLLSTSLKSINGFNNLIKESKIS